MPEGEEKEREIGNLFEETVKEKFHNLVKQIDMQVQEAQRVPNKMDVKRPTPRHIIIKMSKVKEKNQKSKRKIVKLPTGEFLQDCQLISQKKLCRPEGIGKKYLKS